jgi:hypothetical protein
MSFLHFSEGARALSDSYGRNNEANNRQTFDGSQKYNNKILVYIGYGEQ